MPALNRRRLLAAAGATGVAGAAALLADARWLEPNSLEYTTLSVTPRAWPDGIGPIRVGLASDFHCDCASALRRTEDAAALMRRADPDLVCLTGDFVTSHGEQWASACADALAPAAAAPLGAFAVLGNHDYWSGSDEIVERELARVGITVLKNASARLRGTGNVWVTGVESVLTGRADADAALRAIPAGAAAILLVHEPDFADRVEGRVSLQLSGHSHGGQVRLPGLPSHTPVGAKRFRSGLYSTHSHPVFVTRGIGMIGPRFRLFCPPEVALVTISSARTGAGTDARMMT